VLAVAPRLCSTASGMAVDDQTLPWPKIPAHLGLSHLQLCGPTPADCVFLVGDSPDSIDSRTFGCIPKTSIAAELRPFLVEALLP
jgi:type IV secretory pathway protease TraF